MITASVNDLSPVWWQTITLLVTKQCDSPQWVGLCSEKINLNCCLQKNVPQNDPASTSWAFSQQRRNSGIDCPRPCVRGRTSGNSAAGGHFKNTYELLNLRALKFPHVNKIYIFQCMGKIFCVEFQRYPLKFHTKYLTHTLKWIIFIQHWNFKSS